MEFSAARARQKLAELDAVHQAQRRAEADRMRLFAEFADEYRWLPDDGPALAGAEGFAHWGGDGTPGVAEFCTLEVAAALRLTEESVRLDIGYALAVRHRLPQTWTATMAGRLRVWQAKEFARLTHDLSYEQAVALDREVGPQIGQVSYTRLTNLIRGRVLELAQALATTEHEQLKAQCDVVVEEPVAGYARVFATLPAAEALVLKAQIDRVAHLLVQQGSTESLGMRRALALGMLANPARALQVLQASVQGVLPAADADCPSRGQAGHLCGQVTVDPDRLLPQVNLTVHLTDQVLRDGDGVVRGEALGPLLAGWVKDLVAHTRVTVRPVLDAGNIVPSDSYECPPRMREAVELRNPYEVFPYSKRRSRGLDMDHTQRWQDAPPELLTRTGNLGPLSRKVHRAKTHGGWLLEQTAPGVFVWHSPLGFGYLVTPSASWMIKDPTGRIMETPEPLR